MGNNQGPSKGIDGDWSKTVTWGNSVIQFNLSSTVNLGTRKIMIVGRWGHSPNYFIIIGYYCYIGASYGQIGRITKRCKVVVKSI
jgi:hypothetical protein